MSKQKFYITTPIYYASGKAHIGHAYTTIAADVLARYKRINLGPQNVFFLTGTDEHGLKIAEKAKKVNKDPQCFVDEIAQSYQNLWEKLDIDYNKFIRTTDKEHEEFVKDFVIKLKENNYLYEAEYEGLYCVACEKYLQEKDLVNGKCPDHLIEPELLREKNWFFDLKGEYTGRNFLKEIKNYILEGKLSIEPESIKKEVLSLLDQDLPNFSISRDRNKVRWGIELPWDSSQLIYVWADALTNYLSAVQSLDFWPAQIQLLGKDIIKFHAIYWPAMLLANNYELPEKLFAHGFFTVNGQKMSKTIGNVLDPEEITEEYGSDFTRYILLSSFPFGQDGDIDKDAFIEKYNAFFANNLGNLLNRLLVLIAKYYDSCLDFSLRDLNIDKEFITLLEKEKALYVENMEKLRFHQIFRQIQDLLTYANEYISNLELWKLAKENPINSEKHFLALIEFLYEIVLLLYPLLPKASVEIANLLEQDLIYNKRTWHHFASKHCFAKSKILFPRK